MFSFTQVFILQSSNTQDIYYRLETHNIELGQYTTFRNSRHVCIKSSTPLPLMATVQTQQIRDGEMELKSHQTKIHKN